MLCVSYFPCCYDKTPSSSNLKQLRGYSWLWWGSRGGCSSACGSRNPQHSLAQSCRSAGRGSPDWKPVGSIPARPIYLLVTRFLSTCEPSVPKWRAHGNISHPDHLLSPARPHLLKVPHLLVVSWPGTKPTTLCFGGSFKMQTTKAVLALK